MLAFHMNFLIRKKRDGFEIKHETDGNCGRTDASRKENSATVTRAYKERSHPAHPIHLFFGASVFQSLNHHLKVFAIDWISQSACHSLYERACGTADKNYTRVGGEKGEVCDRSKFICICLASFIYRIHDWSGVPR